MSISQYLGVQLSIGMEDCGENFESALEFGLRRTAAEGEAECIGRPPRFAAQSGYDVRARLPFAASALGRKRYTRVVESEYEVLTRALAGNRDVEHVR